MGYATVITTQNTQKDQSDTDVIVTVAKFVSWLVVHQHLPGHLHKGSHICSPFVGRLFPVLYVWWISALKLASYILGSSALPGHSIMRSHILGIPSRNRKFFRYGIFV